MAPPQGNGKNGILHSAVVYSDCADRNRLIDAVLSASGVRFDGVAVFSCRPKYDTRYFSRKGGWLRRRLPCSVFDAEDMLGRVSNMSNEILTLYREATGRPGSRVVFIGDWAHLRYEEFEVVLEAERAHTAHSNVPICCYRAEGFWSLAPEDIAEVVQLHRRILVGSSVIEMDEPLGGARASSPAA